MSSNRTLSALPHFTAHYARFSAESWYSRHLHALLTPNVAEQTILLPLKAVSQMLQRHEQTYGGTYWDGVLGVGVAHILKGTRVLLNGDCGRIEAGAVDEYIRYLADRSMVDLDTVDVKVSD